MSKEYPSRTRERVKQNEAFAAKRAKGIGGERVGRRWQKKPAKTKVEIVDDATGKVKRTVEVVVTYEKMRAIFTPAIHCMDGESFQLPLMFPV